ncbi:MAG: hypothetical protein IJU00_10255 [Selenomonas sp.]|nr:hypothetical protein [Selenomonas sp.]
MELPVQDGLDINCLHETFNRTTNSHKYFWFLSLLSSVEDNLNTCCFNDLAIKMICIAQPYVLKQHLTLGYRDTLETAVTSTYGNKSVDQQKLRAILAHVPYRFLSPFAKNLTEDEMDGNRKSLVHKLNLIPNLPYRFTDLNGLNSKIFFNPDWYTYFQEHHHLLRNWTLEMLRAYLNKRN